MIVSVILVILINDVQHVNMFFFYVLLIVHLGIILTINQLDAQNLAL